MQPSIYRLFDIFPDMIVGEDLGLGYEGGVRLDSCQVQVVMAHSVLITQAEDHLSWNVARLWSSDEAQVNWYKLREDKSMVFGREPTKCTVEMGDVRLGQLREMVYLGVG